MKTLFILVAVMMTITVAAADEIALPPDAPDALAALNASPRHGTWIDIEGPGLKAPLRTWTVYRGGAARSHRQLRSQTKPISTPGTTLARRLRGFRTC